MQHDISAAKLSTASERSSNGIFSAPSVFLAASILAVCLTSQSGSASPLTNDVAAVSVTNSETNGNGPSIGPSVSTDKNLVAFISSSTNLISAGSTGTQAFVRDRTAGTTKLFSKNGSASGNGNVTSLALSGDGSTLAFATQAKNLLDTPNSSSSIYSAVVSSGVLTLVSNNSTLTSTTTSNTAPSISDNGTRVTFLTNKAFGACADLSNVVLSASGTLSCISTNSTFTSQAESEARISGDGTTVAIVSTSDGASSQIYSLAVATSGTVTRISELSGSAGNGASGEISINQAGTSIAFASAATNLTSPAQGNATKAIYLYRQGNTPIITLVSKTSSGTKCNGESSAPAISKNGNFIAFLSKCRDLTTDNPSTTDIDQVFVYNVSTDAVVARASLKSSGAAINGVTAGPLFIDNAGQVVVFSSAIAKIGSTPNDQNGASDVFSYDSTCSSNSDGAGRTDCTDKCPYDATKDANEGVCGCGFGEGDTDGDGSADCEDKCPTDPLKITSELFCGCGNAETDSDANGVVDCLDPTSSTVPNPAVFAPDPSRTSGVLTFPGSFVARSVTFEYQFRRDGAVVRGGTTKSRTVRIRPLGLGRFTLRYRVFTTNATSRWSTSVQIVNRLYPRRR